MADSRNKILQSTTSKGMYLDTPPSLQPDGTYREAWGVVNSTDAESGFGIANEASNTIHTLLPKGYEVRGLAYAEERDQFVVFLYSYDEVKSEIGIIDEKTKTYRTVVNDDKLPDGKMCFGDEFINIELKIEQPCNQLHAYWSNDYTYRFINLESDCCDYTLADMELFRCICGPNIEPYVQEGGGVLENGTYQFVAQLEDDDGNTTNWFRVSQPIYIAEKDYVGGELTRRSIRLDITDLDPEYSQVNVAVIKTVLGTTTPPEIVFRRNYAGSKVTLIYTGQKGQSIELEEVISKNPSYIRGRNLSQKDGRLILYNILGETNLDYQRHANEIEVTYATALVPAEDAHFVKTLRRDENYMLGIRWNYCDGTSSADFVIPGRPPTDNDLKVVKGDADENCSICDKPRWAVYNTAKLTYTNTDFHNAYEQSSQNSSIFKRGRKVISYTPPPYSEETEEVIIPDAFKDLLDYSPDEQVANICSCLEDILVIKGLGFVVGGTDGNVTIGISQECCERLQSTLTNVSNVPKGLNDLLGSLTDLFPNDEEENDDSGGGLDPGLNCESYNCRNIPCPPGCQCLDNTFCRNDPNFAPPTSNLQDGQPPAGYVLPSKQTTPNIPPFLHDITMQDIDGNVHNIKSYLDDNKIVYLKAFTTWCGPCYDQHLYGNVDFFYNTYGPSGLDMVQVIAVEFDPATSIADIEGTGPKTQGDFTTAPYPIVAGDTELIETLATTYGVQYFPQIIVIYPNGVSGTVPANQLEQSIDQGATIVPDGPAPMELSIKTIGVDINGTCPGGNCGGGSTYGGCTGGGCGSSGKCGGSGTCSNGVPYDSCYECTDSGYCRYTCFKKPQTYLQAIQNLLFHVIEKERRRKFYRYSRNTNSDVAGDGGGGDIAALTDGTCPGGNCGGGGTGGASGGSGLFSQKYVSIKQFSDDGCEIIGKKYPIVSRGDLGYWESSETYPLTKDCNGKYLFGDLAGKPVRLHRTPDSQLEPHFVSYHDGVVHAADRSGYELQDTYIRPIWFEFKNIKFPENLPKPLCPNNPFTITYVKRDQTNKRVIASGLFTHTFLGNVFDKDYVFPKHAVNSLEYVDRNIYNDPINDPTCESSTCYYQTDCGPGCECFGAEVTTDTKYCQAPAPVQCDYVRCSSAGECGDGCDCLPDLSPEQCVEERCTFTVSCPQGCECSGPINTPNSSQECVPTFSCYPRPDCEAIPCSADIDCVGNANCTVCKPVEGTPGTCRPISSEKQGKDNDFPIYNFHSPDTSFDRPFIGGANRAKFDLVMFGWGFRHGLYAEGEEPDDIWKQQIDQRGTRQSINLNHYLPAGFFKVNKCISGVTYAEADSIVDAPEGFFFEKVGSDNKVTKFPAPLLNLNRESSVFIQFQGTYVNPLPRLLRADLSDQDNEYKTDDASFIGDGHCHECLVPRAGAWYGSIIHDRLDQYGSVEGLRMIPLGVEGSMEDAYRGQIAATTGDAYIGPWTLVRKSYVSNKVGDNVEDPTSSQLKQFLCFGDCSKLPKSCNGRDPKNRANLRPWINNGCPRFDEVFTRTNLRDFYYARTLKTLLVTWVESDTNTWYRELGEADNFELAYPHLKDKPLDSSLTGIHFDECFLNQFAERHERIPRWKLYAKAIIRVLVMFVPIFWLIKDGLKITADYTDIFIIALRLAIYISFWYLLVFVIMTCSNINKILGIYQCKNDEQGAPEEDNVRGFRDNYTRYNYDYSAVNDLGYGFSVNSNYDVSTCLAEETNKVVYSDPQVQGSSVNSWRNFRINNYLLLPSDSGPIQDIFVLGNNLYIQTTDNLWTTYSNPAQLTTNDGQNIYIGRGEFMNRVDPIYGGVVEGGAGTRDPNASVISKYGHISVDREARLVNIFGGNGVEALSSNGLRHFMKENLYLRLLDQFPDFALVDRKTRYGIGFSIGIDNELDRILVTKIDYEAYNPEKLRLTEDKRAFLNESGEMVLAGDPRYFCNKSFTASYSFLTKSWVSFHYYTPNWYAWNRFTMYTFNDLAMWEHNIVGHFQTFYDERYPMTVEIVANDFFPFKYGSTIVDTEASQYINGQYLTSTKATFNSVVAYNRHQSTGEMRLVEQEDRDILENSTEDLDSIALEYNLPKWTFAELRDRLSNRNDVMFLRDCEIGPRKVNNNNISSDVTNNTFVDNYLVYLLKFDTFDDIKLLVRGVFTNVDIEER